MNRNNFCVIMAGGIGSRFWPLSRTKYPKQFLDILGLGKSFLQMTYERFLKVCPPENIYIITNEMYSEVVAKQLPDIDPSQILGEPLRRNTAPCIAYTNMKIREINPDAKIITAPSDHLILNEEKFIETIKIGLSFIENNDGLLTIGITPSRPETGYGYIQADKNASVPGFPEIQKVKTFTEKPDYDIALKFVQSGEFSWNAGIFIWSMRSIDNAFNRYLPDVADLFSPQLPFQNIEEQTGYINRAYAACKNISIDNGIMEHADNVYVLCSEFGWSDLGTWDSLFENAEKSENNNVISGDNVLVYDTKNCIVHVPNEKLVVLQGLDECIVAESDNILLICKRNSEKQIRRFVNDVKVLKGERFV